MALLERAEMVGDESLARGVALQAHTNGWTDVLDKFAESRPPQFEALASLMIDPEASTNALLDDFRYVVPKPNEIAGVADFHLQEMADA
jgi:hypothetical protein